MTEAKFIQFINDAFLSMAVGQEPFFKELWKNGKLSYNENPDQVDILDEYNTKLLCTALDKRQSCLLVLPDDKAHRCALMFGTALLKCAVRCIEGGRDNIKILYFGTTLGFKYSLSKTSVGRITLDSVFNYTQASGKFNKLQNYRQFNPIASNLPEVVCVYQPTNPGEFVQIYQPDWIAVDCGKNNEIEWLDELLSYCNKKGIPVIGWSQNSFSNVIKLFEKHKGRVYYSPNGIAEGNENDFGSLFLNKEQCIVEPVLFSKASIAEIDDLLIQSKNILRELNKSDLGHLKTDALRTGWIYLRTIERLSIPVSVYNEEVKSFRFVFSLDTLKQSLSRYTEIISKTDGNFSDKLDLFNDNLHAIIHKFNENYPPYWVTLSNYCLDSPPLDVLRILIFPKRHQKQIFSYTLLSKYNISDDELLQNRCIIRTLKEFTNPSKADIELFSHYRSFEPIVSGLPDYSNRNIYQQAINRCDLKALIYPHQIGTLKSILTDFNLREIDQIDKSIATLKILSGKNEAQAVPKVLERYIISDKATELNIESDKVNHQEKIKTGNLINVGDLYSELAFIFDSSDQDEEDSDFLVSINLATTEESSDGRVSAFMTEDFIEIQFEGSYRLRVASTDEVSLLKNGKIDKIFIGAIRHGDKVVFIENQSRRNLYDLILTRIHNHPSLEVHLAMLKKWKEEFYLGFTIWKEDKFNHNLSDFLLTLQNKGSEINTELTVNNWVNGYVMRPHDQEDLRRIGEIIKSKFLIDNYKSVANAASRIVGIHISLSRKLNTWMEEKSKDFHRDDMELIDEELGLTFGDLRSSIKVLKVSGVRRLKGPVLSSYLGRLERDN
jgi:hypothetical protein